MKDALELSVYIDYNSDYLRRDYSAFAVIRSLDQSCACNIKLMCFPLTLGH